MKTRKLILLVVVTFAVAFSASANNIKTLSFRTEVTLNGNKLPTGSYEVNWVSHSPEATVTFVKAGQVMMTAMGFMPTARSSASCCRTPCTSKPTTRAGRASSPRG